MKRCLLFLFLIVSSLTAELSDNRQETWNLASGKEVSFIYDWEGNCVQWSDWTGTTRLSVRWLPFFNKFSEILS